jgi:hypothetical protein
VALQGSNVRVAWVDNRNSCGGEFGYDTYVNFSSDAGLTWHGYPKRFESGDGPGCSDSAWPALSFAPDQWTSVAWLDHRNGYHSIRINSELGLADDDGDGRSSPGSDCNDANASVWSVPSEVRSLVFSSRTALGWTAPSEPGGSGPLYDTLRSGTATDFGGGGACVEANGADLLTTDTADPAVGAAFYYLTRAETSCGSGTLGARSGGTERIGRNCP